MLRIITVYESEVLKNSFDMRL